jgi:drug/metabolite transporter (DMT)-like permease
VPESNARTADVAPHPTAEEPTERSLGILAVLFTTIVWGLVPLVLKEVRMPTLAFASWRLGFGVVVYGIALAVTGRRLRWATIKRCAPGGLLFALDVGLSFNAFRLTSVANATIIGALSPVAIAVGAAIWFGERFERRDLWFMAASFFGVALVAIGSAGTSGWSVLGDVFAFGSVFAWSAYWLFSKRARSSASALEYMATVMFVAFVAMTTVTALAGISLAPPRGMDWFWIWAVVLIPGATGHLLLAWSHRHVEAWLGSLITQCMPVVGSVAAWIVLGETLTPLTIAGGLVVLAATAAIVVHQSRSAPAGEELRAPDPTG